MRDEQIYALINTAANNVQRVFDARMMTYERLIKEITEQLGGVFFLINSIPILGILIRKMIERKIREFQRVLKQESIKLYQKAKEEAKRRELDRNTRKGQGST